MEKSFAWERPAQLTTTSIRELSEGVWVKVGLGRWAAKGREGEGVQNHVLRVMFPAM